MAGPYSYRFCSVRANPRPTLGHAPKMQATSSSSEISGPSNSVAVPRISHNYIGKSFRPKEFLDARLIYGDHAATRIKPLRICTTQIKASGLGGCD